LPSPSRLHRLARLTAIAAPMLVVAFGGLFVAAAAEFAAGDAARVVAVFPPWWRGDRALAEAAAVAPVAGVAAPFAVAVIADRPGVIGELRRRGAWFVADGRRFPACFALPRTQP
jgi:hypothetical protein